MAEEQAEGVVQLAMDHNVPLSDRGRTGLQAAIADAIRAAIAEEREACAKVADGWADQDYFAGGIAAAIRARGDAK